MDTPRSFMVSCFLCADMPSRATIRRFVHHSTWPKRRELNVARPQMAAYPYIYIDYDAYAGPRLCFPGKDDTLAHFAAGDRVSMWSALGGGVPPSTSHLTSWPPGSPSDWELFGHTQVSRMAGVRKMGSLLWCVSMSSYSATQ